MTPPPDDDEPEAKEEPVARWLMTYADMITLCMAFFVLLYSFSILDLQKFQSAAASVRSSFGALHNQGSTGILQGHKEAKPFGKSQLHIPSGEYSAIKRQVEQLVHQLGLEGKVEIQLVPEGYSIRITEAVLFDSGKADLKPQARQVLDKIVKIIRATPYPVRVEGHTDSLPIHNAQFPSNWELSAARAATVVHYLIKTHAYPPSKLSLAGYGSTRPVASNATPAGRARNRRIELVVLAGSKTLRKSPLQTSSAD